MNAIVKAEHQAPAAVSIMEVVARAASDPNVDMDKMERLLQMQERIMERNAKAAFAEALARLQPKLPIINERGGIKDRNGNVQSRYALWEDIVGIITPILADEGFSLSFRTEGAQNGVTVTGVLMHREGHSEQTSLPIPLDTSGSKNNVQGVGSSTSYGKRYTASALLNLRTGEVDDDGQAGGGSTLPTITDKQVADLDALLSETGADKAAFMRWGKITSLSQILAKNYDHIVREVRSKGGKK